MTQGLIGGQEIVKVRIASFMRDSIRDGVMAELATRPLHRIDSLSTVAGGDEFNGVVRAVAVIEYLEAT